jgi:hypothetical protein
MRIALIVLLLAILTSSASARDIEPVARSSSPRGFSYDLYALEGGTAPTVPHTTSGNDRFPAAATDTTRTTEQGPLGKLPAGASKNAAYAQLQVRQVTEP